MIKRGLSIFDPPNDLVDASGVTPKLGEGERVLWIGTPGWFSSFFCTNSWGMPAVLVAAFILYRGLYVRTAAQYAIDGLIAWRWGVVGFTVFFAFIINFVALYMGGAFVYILTTKRMMVKVDRTRLLVRLFQYFKKVSDADGFAAYDLRYLNGARVYAGPLGYGNVSVSYKVGTFGSLRGDLDTYKSEPVFRRARRYVKVYFRSVVFFHPAETFCNVYFGIKDVDRLGDLLNDQCAAHLSKR
ncbi:MAG: hypothetical protein NTAFB05_09780 [Nitrobacter sp.]|uniref:hypothetical protein n=1 Tax=Nitrobacter sp. TaxID=29420 RepID=UPI00387DDDA9